MPFATHRFSCQRTAPASRRSLGTQLPRPQCDLQEAEIQDGAVEVLSEKLKENVPSVPIFPRGDGCSGRKLSVVHGRCTLRYCGTGCHSGNDYLAAALEPYILARMSGCKP